MAKARLQLVCGEDDYLVTEKAKAVIDAWVPAAERDFGLEIVDGRVDTVDSVCAAVSQCVEALRTMGFFGGGKTVWLRDASFLAGGGRSFDSPIVKEQIDKLTAVVKAGLGEGQALLVSARAVPRNSALFKAIQAAGEVADFGGEAKPWEREKTARETLAALLDRCGLTMDEKVRDEFLARVGTDTRTMLQEVEKLSLYRGGPGPVAAADVEAVTSVGREAEAWDLTDALGNRDRLALVAALRRLEEQNAAPVMLSAMLDGRVRDLILLRAALDGGWLAVRGRQAAWGAPPREAELAFGAGTGDLRKQSPFRMAKLAEQAANYTLNELRAARHYLMEMREQMVSTALDGGFLLETTLLRIVGPPRRARQAAKRTND